MLCAALLAAVLGTADPSVQRDVAYGEDPAQRFDVYLPEHAHAAPIVAPVHGGAWALGDKANAGVVANKAARWLPHGAIVVSINYRLLPQASPLVQAQDVARALARIQKRAGSWGGDPTRVVLMGHSSGAHLVALLAASPTLAQEQGARPWLGTVLLDSAALDVEGVMAARRLPLYDDAFGSDPAAWRASSPLRALGGKPAPMLAVCSSLRANSCPNAQRFADRAAALGARATTLPVSLTHAEINRELGLPGDSTAQVEDFLRSLGLAL